MACCTGETCLISDPFECQFTTEAVCNGVNGDEAHATQVFSFDNSVSRHLHETQVTLFYFCDVHAHTHREAPEKLRAELCYIQSSPCCDRAVFVKNLKESFSIIQTLDSDLSPLKTYKEFIIYDPSLWRDQSFSYFTSLVKSIQWAPQSMNDRYKNFEASNFKVSSIKYYKSGKHAMHRTNITGFDTNGIYQTATMSCDLPQDVVMLPQYIYNIMKFDYDMSFVCLKRDPSIKPTCMFILRTIVNPDPSIQVIVINDAIAKPLNQDQDGDKNAIYALPKHTKPSYNKFDSFLHKVSKVEMNRAFVRRLTLIGFPRYSFSENSRQIIYRFHRHLLDTEIFYQRTHSHGLDYMIDAGCGYLSQEYDKFCSTIRTLNHRPVNLLTFDDVIGRTNGLRDIVMSSTKSHLETLESFYRIVNNKENRSLKEQLAPSLKQMSRYITSGQNLRETGRERFILLYSEGELKSSFGTIYVNTKAFADLKTFFPVFLFMFSEASLSEFIKDIESL